MAIGQKRRDIPADLKNKLDALFEMSRRATDPDAPGNEHEAALAAAAAARLLQKHNLTREDILDDEQDEQIIMVQAPWLNKTRTNWETNLCSAVARANFCRIIINSTKSGGLFEIFGYETDAQVAQFIFLQLQKRLKKIAYQKGAERTAQRRMIGYNTKDVRGSQNHVVWHNSFLLGAAEGVRQQLNKTVEEFQQSGQRMINTETGQMEFRGTAIVRVRAEQVDDAIAKVYPKLGRVKRTKTKFNQTGYEQGVTTGKNIDIRPGLTVGNS